MSILQRRLAALATAVLVSASGLSAQSPGGQRSLYDRYTEPIHLYETGLGDFSRPISSASAEAQAYFNQGFALMYAFAKAEAVRSFREAWKRDPDCAICYWGEAWAWGSYLNGPMTEEEAPHAYAAMRRAVELRGTASRREQAFIDAIAVRYVERFDPAKRLEQDEPYAEAMRTVAERYPDDLDAATLYADALFVMEPRRGTRDVNDPRVQRLHQVLEGVLDKDVHHPGACHLYVHATESTVVPERAEGCARFLGASMPGASHINHMPSHTWNRVGRWGDSVRANLEAWHSDLKAARGEGIAIYPDHNLHMLLYAASMDGQGAIAMQAGKDYAKNTGDTLYQVLTLLRFGRFDEILAVTARPSGEISGGLWDFTRGYAHLRGDEADFARVYLARVETLASSSKASFRGHSAGKLLGTAAGILQGEILRAEGRLPEAIAAFEKATGLYDSLDYDEPEPLPFAAEHWLGAAYLEARRFEDAERVYRADLERHPHNGWSLFGLEQALAGQGKATTAVDADFESSWARSDTWIWASRF